MPYISGNINIIAHLISMNKHKLSKLKPDYRQSYLENNNKARINFNLYIDRNISDDLKQKIMQKGLTLSSFFSQLIENELSDPKILK